MSLNVTVYYGFGQNNRKNHQLLVILDLCIYQADFAHSKIDSSLNSTQHTKLAHVQNACYLYYKRTREHICNID